MKTPFDAETFYYVVSNIKWGLMRLIMSVFFQENVSGLAPYGGIEDQRCDTQDSY